MDEDWLHAAHSRYVFQPDQAFTRVVQQGEVITLAVLDQFANFKSDFPQLANLFGRLQPPDCWADRSHRQLHCLKIDLAHHDADNGSRMACTTLVLWKRDARLNPDDDKFEQLECLD